ncbi:MAG: folate family ECF transporter S component [Clostridia bacterium]|nr:folate family ECF transporter S component [Clostridia bacterium]
MSNRIPTPFTKDYWKHAANELKDTRMLVFAALIVALRVAIKMITIPISQNLIIAFEFFPAALGSVVYGPIIALFSGAASDVLGWLLFPRGPFFPPYMLVPMLSGFLFALFFYRAPVTFIRSLLSKTSVNVLCNAILTTIMIAWMQGRAALVLDIPRIIKNFGLLPFEVIALYIVLRAIWPSLLRYGFVSLPEGADAKPGRVESFLMGKTVSLLSRSGKKKSGGGDAG